jgi:hypothetical protein
MDNITAMVPCTIFARPNRVMDLGNTAAEDTIGVTAFSTLYIGRQDTECVRD